MIIKCPWCGNTWEQEDAEPERCKVCKHYCWEGTDETHKMFEDITAWEKYITAIEEYKEDREWDYMAHTDIRN